MILLLDILFQWASPSCSFIKIFFFFLRGRRYSFPVEIAIDFLPALCGEGGKKFTAKLKMRNFHFEISLKIKEGALLAKPSGHDFLLFHLHGDESRGGIPAD